MFVFMYKFHFCDYGLSLFLLVVYYIKVYLYFIMSFEVCVNRTKWLGHVLEIEDNRTVKKQYKDSPCGARPRGRPKSWWRDSILSDLGQLRIKISLAQDRTG